MSADAVSYWTSKPAQAHGLSSTERFVQLVVALAMGQETNTGAVSNAWLQAQTGFSKRTVTNALNALEAKKLISREERTGPNGARLADRLTFVPCRHLHGGEAEPACRQVTGGVSRGAPLLKTTVEDPSTTDNHLPPVGAAKASPDRKGTRIAWDWVASPKGRTFAEERGFAPDEITRMEDRFLDFWRAKAGAGGTKLDWDATWRVWVDKEADRRGGRNGPGRNAAPGSSPADRRFQARQDRVGRMQRGAVAALERERRGE